MMQFGEWTLAFQNDGTFWLMDQDQNGVIVTESEIENMLEQLFDYKTGWEPEKK